MSCTGCNDGCFDESVQLATGLTGANGLAGDDGINGLYGGWSLKWKFDTNTGSGTGTNEVRLNNASPASATEIYVNDDAFGTGAADVFLSSVTSAPYGRIKIFKEYDSTIFWLATITAADDTTVPAEVKFTVTDVVTNGTFTDADDIVLTLAPAGATGATGGTGTDGITVLDYRTADGQILLNGVGFYPGIINGSNFNQAILKDTTNANNLQTTIPANTLQNVGDVIKVHLEGVVKQPGFTDSSSGALQFSIWWDTTIIGGFNIGTYAKYNLGSQAFDLDLEIAMVDNTLITTGNVQVSYKYSTYEEAMVTAFGNRYNSPLRTVGATSITINEVLTNPHTIYIKGENDSTNGNIVDLENTAGKFVYDEGYVLSYEVIKYKK